VYAGGRCVGTLGGDHAWDGVRARAHRPTGAAGRVEEGSSSSSALPPRSPQQEEHLTAPTAGRGSGEVSSLGHHAVAAVATAEREVQDARCPRFNSAGRGGCKVTAPNRRGHDRNELTSIAPRLKQRNEHSDEGECEDRATPHRG
jgi:hypothetical protein